MDIAGAKRLQALEEENNELKRMYAEAMLGNNILKKFVAERGRGISSAAIARA